MKNILLIALSVVLLSFNFIDTDINEVPPYDQKEQFDPRLSNINSIDKLENYIDSALKKDSIQPKTIDYVVTIRSPPTSRPE